MKRTELNQMVHIAKLVERKTGVSIPEMQGKSRRRARVVARYASMYLIRYAYKIPLTKIGEFFDRDHSVVIHGMQKVDDMLTVNDKYFRWLKDPEFTKLIKRQEVPFPKDELLETLYRLKSATEGNATYLAQKAIDLRNYEQNREQVELALTAMKIDQMMNDDLN